MYNKAKVDSTRTARLLPTPVHAAPSFHKRHGAIRAATLEILQTQLANLLLAKSFAPSSVRLDTFIDQATLFMGHFLQQCAEGIYVITRSGSHIGLRHIKNAIGPSTRTVRIQGR